MLSKIKQSRLNHSRIKHSRTCQSRICKTKKSKLYLNNIIYLKSFANLTSLELKQLSYITNDLETMKYIGKGNLWSINDLEEFQQEEQKEVILDQKNRKHYTYVLIYNNIVIGFIEGRKNKSLLPKNIKTGIYDILLRMFISRDYIGKGFGKKIIKLFILEYSRLLKQHKTNKIHFTIYSDIDPDNIPSIKIHLANGFISSGKFKYPNGKIYNRYKYISR